MKLDIVKNGLTTFVSRAGLKLSKHSPEILIGTGIAAIIGGTVMACKATLKVDDILDERDEKMEKIEEVYQDVQDNNDIVTYTEKDYKRDRTIVTIQTGAKLVKAYAPGVTLVAGGIICVLAAHGIMKKRSLALMAAYKAIETQFSEYRERVKEAVGEEVEKSIYTNAKKPTKEEVKDGAEPDIPIVDGLNPSIYARFFDETSTKWQKNAEYNLMFLNMQQNYANDLLRSRGHLFLNEVYDMLGLQRSQAGQFVGWVRGHGDDCVDFGIYNVQRPKSRDFVNGYERSILLDFNINGVIYDLI